MLGKETIKFEILTLNVLRTKNWTMETFVNWLLGGHIHFVLCHVHQGMESSAWNVVDLYAELNRLQMHEGFPSGIQLQCPVFTQDKREYLKLLPDITLPTYFITIPTFANDDVMCATISRY